MVGGWNWQAWLPDTGASCCQVSRVIGPWVDGCIRTAAPVNWKEVPLSYWAEAAGQFSSTSRFPSSPQKNTDPSSYLTFVDVD